MTSCKELKLEKKMTALTGDKFLAKLINEEMLPALLNMIYALCNILNSLDQPCTKENNTK